MERPAAQAAAVLRWLLLNPVEFEMVLALARLSDDPPGFAEAGEHGQRVRTFFAGSLFALCDRCAWPLVLLADGRRVSWPGLAAHRHFDGGEAQPVEQPPFKRQGAGSNPAAPTTHTDAPQRRGRGLGL